MMDGLWNVTGNPYNQQDAVIGKEMHVVVSDVSAAVWKGSDSENLNTKGIEDAKVWAVNRAASHIISDLLKWYTPEELDRLIQEVAYGK